jgi:SAM-dependent methyltransferase
MAHRCGYGHIARESLSPRDTQDADQIRIPSTVGATGFAARRRSDPVEPGAARGDSSGEQVIDAREHALVRHLLDCGHDSRQDVNLRIHPADEMLLFAHELVDGNRDLALCQYVHSGLGILDAVRQIVRWRFGSFGDIGSFLDFACGYGRVNRFLVHELPPERVTVSDILADAIEFQKREFGVRGVVSVADPDDLRLEDTFDCVFVASLFTHLPEETFTRWLARLWALVRRGGLLLFSTHDLPAGKTATGDIDFTPVSESRTLDATQYGSAFVTPSFVARALDSVGAGRSWTRLPRGLNRFQDLYVVVNGDDADFKNLQFDPGPEGCVDTFSITLDGTTVISGWAADRSPSAAVDRVEVFFNGRRVAASGSFEPRPDVAAYFGNHALINTGWECRAELGAGLSHSTDVLLVRAVSDAGIPEVLFIGSIEGALLRHARNRLELLAREPPTRRELRRLRHQVLHRIEAILGQATRRLCGKTSRRARTTAP